MGPAPQLRRAGPTCHPDPPKEGDPAIMARRKRFPRAVAERLTAGVVCEWCALEGRSQRGEQIHHRLTRARGGPHDEFNCVFLCRMHHDRAHAFNEWPWLVGGRILRGVYLGPDPTYALVYNGAELPEPPALTEEYFPDVDVDLIAWAIRRAWETTGILE